MYVWLCMYGYVCMAMYVRLCMYGYVCMAMHVWLSMYVCMCVWMCVCMYGFMYVCMYVCVCVYVCGWLECLTRRRDGKKMYVRMYVYIHQDQTCMYVYIHIVYGYVCRAMYVCMAIYVTCVNEQSVIVVECCTLWCQSLDLFSISHYSCDLSTRGVCKIAFRPHSCSTDLLQ